MIDESLLAKVI